MAYATRRSTYALCFTLQVAGVVAAGFRAPAGGVGLIRCEDYADDRSSCREYSPASIVAKLPTDAYEGYYGVSSALQYAGWTLLAAPHASGPFLCQAPRAESENLRAGA